MPFRHPLPNFLARLATAGLFLSLARFQGLERRAEYDLDAITDIAYPPAPDSRVQPQGQVDSFAFDLVRLYPSIRT